MLYIRLNLTGPNERVHKRRIIDIRQVRSRFDRC